MSAAWALLPREVLRHGVLSYLINPADISAVSRVCRAFAAAVGRGADSVFFERFAADIGLLNNANSDGIVTAAEARSWIPLELVPDTNDSSGDESSAWASVLRAWRTLYPRFVAVEDALGAARVRSADEADYDDESADAGDLADQELLAHPDAMLMPDYGPRRVFIPGVTPWDVGEAGPMVHAGVCLSGSTLPARGQWLFEVEVRSIRFCLAVGVLAAQGSSPLSSVADHVIVSDEGDDLGADRVGYFRQMNDVVDATTAACKSDPEFVETFHGYYCGGVNSYLCSRATRLANLHVRRIQIAGKKVGVLVDQDRHELRAVIDGRICLEAVAVDLPARLIPYIFLHHKGDAITVYPPKLWLHETTFGNPETAR